jgi:hypothetical protein
VPFVCQSGAHIAGGEPPPAAEGTSVRVFVLEDLCVRSKGMNVKV